MLIHCPSPETAADFQVRLDRAGTVLIAQARGPATVDNLMRVLDEIETHTRAWGCRLALVDLLQVDGKLPFTAQFRVSEQAGMRLAHLDCLASVVRPQDMTGISRKIANRFGLRMRTFSDPQAAMAWLTSAAN